MKYLLNGKWNLKSKDKGYDFIVNAPGSVLNDLLINGEIEDPYYRDNELKAEALCDFDYTYERFFDIDNNILDNDYVFLKCDGLDTLTKIVINGIEIAKTTNMHIRYRFDVKEYLKVGENHIHITFYSPNMFVDKMRKEKGKLWGVVDARDGYQYLRKAHYMFGWDWGPRIPDMGIFRDISIEYYNGGYIKDCMIDQIHDNGEVKLTFKTEYESITDIKENIIVIDSKGNEIINEELINKEYDIKNPKLWWPVEYGEQPLYKIVYQLITNNIVVDEKTYKIGLRTFIINQEKIEYGEQFCYCVNGVDIFAKGANYIPEDNLLPRCNKERTRKLIKNALKANFNSLRVWGGGIYPESYFFEMCDEYGIMVWPDFMFACAQYKVDDLDFVKSIEDEIEDNIKRLRHHPSIALWCGNNEMEQLWLDEQTDGRVQTQLDEYLVLFEDIIKKVAIKYDPNRLYWPSSPSSGGGFDNPNDESRGDIHYWDVWHKEMPFTDYRKYYFRFCSEFGFQSFPCLKTIETFTKKEDRNIFSRIMELHQKNKGANGRILKYLSYNFRLPKDFDSLLYVSQILQGEAIKYGVEHWRRNRGRCMGSIYWQYNDCYPVASWSSIDVDNRWKALHYYAKRFYNPILLSACEDGVKVELHISNEQKNKTKGILEWELVTLDNKILKRDDIKVDISSHTSKCIVKLDFSDTLEEYERRSTSYLKYKYTDSFSNVFTSSILFVPQKHFDFEKANIECDIVENNNQWTLLLKSNKYAKYVELMPEEIDCVFNDNYFDLYPNEIRKIEVDMETLTSNINKEDFLKQIKIRSIENTYE